MITVFTLSACSGSGGGADGLGGDSDAPTPAVSTTGTLPESASETAIDDAPNAETGTANEDIENAATSALVTFDITVPSVTSAH